MGKTHTCKMCHVIDCDSGAMKTLSSTKFKSHAVLIYWVLTVWWMDCVEADVTVETIFSSIYNSLPMEITSNFHCLDWSVKERQIYHDEFSSQTLLIPYFTDSVFDLIVSSTHFAECVIHRFCKPSCLQMTQRRKSFISIHCVVYILT